MDTTPKIPAKRALDAAKRDEKKSGFKTTSPELAILSEPSGQNLVWQYEASLEDPKEGKSRIRYLVDAATGKTIRSYELIAHADVPANLSGNLLPGEGGGAVAFSGAFSDFDSHYYMWDGFDRLAFVYNASTNSGTYADANNYAKRPSSSWGTSDPIEVSAAYNLQKTVDFFKPYGFDVGDIAFTATGQTMLPFVVHYGTNYDNAFWDPGNAFFFGDGDGTSLAPLTTMDVVAHEFGHAWTENSSNLTYLNEAGALNESFSDIVGATVEILSQADDRASYPNAAAGKSDWLIGEDVARLPGLAYKSLRDMRDPANPLTVGTGGVQPTRYKGRYWYSGTGDNGGVHQNSGVQNFFYYLLSEGGKGTNDGILYSVDGIGLTNAFRLAFEANSHFLTSEANYQDARQAWIDAANSVNPAYAASVAAAWDAVGVGPEIDYPASVTSEESFEDSASLPANWTTGANAWTVASSTGAYGSNSLVSPDIGDSLSARVTYTATTPAGYIAFHKRTSSENGWDWLSFYVDGVLKDRWSGENAWSPSFEEISAGSHVFEWRYAKDSIYSEGLDEAGIDAVHVETVTGSLDVASDTGSGSVRSKNGLSAVLAMDGSGTYLFVDDQLGTYSRGTASGTVSIPLPLAQEGTNSIRFQYRNANGFLSPIFEKSFFVDATAPAAANFLTGKILSNGANVDLSWTMASDGGSGLSDIPYSYEVSPSSDFTSIVASGTVASTGATISLADGTYFARVTASDVAGNVTVSGTQQIFVDTVAPNAPSPFSVNSGAIIDAGNVQSVRIEGMATGESGSTAHVSVTDGQGGSYAATTPVAADGSFSVAAADLSALSDGMLTYSAHVVDSVGNVGTTNVGTIGKSVMPADGSVSFLSGSHVDDANAVVTVAALKPVTFELSGSGLAASVTGTLAASGSVDVPVVLSAGEGMKNLVASFTDEGGTVTAASASVILDLAAPTVSVTSHTDGSGVSGTSVTLTGTVSDVGGLASFTVDGQSLPASNGNWSKTLVLAEGENTFVATATDHIGRTDSLTVRIIRTPIVSSLSATQVSGSGFTVTFVTDVVSIGTVEYGTASGSLTGSVTESSSGTSHSVSITGLSEDTQYFIRAYATVTGEDGPGTSVSSVKTPKTASSADYSAVTEATGSVWFEDSTSTGADFGSASGTVTIYSQDGNDSVRIDLGGLDISTSGWDGIFQAPNEASVTGSVNEAGYAQTGSVYAIGNDTARLALSGNVATVRVFLGTALNGKTLRVYHSDDGLAFAQVAECAVSAGICEFEASHFSYYAFAAPSDSTPDAFSFAGKTGVELSTETASDAVTLTGFNVPAAISVVGGTYSVNNGAYVSTGSTVNSGDRVTVKVTSSNAGSTDATATLTVGGVSAPFTVRTKAVTIARPSGGGGGGGGGGSSSSPTTTTATSSSQNSPKPTPSNGNAKKNVVSAANPYDAVIEIARSAPLAKLKKNAKASDIPKGVRPKIDRVVTDRIVKALNLEGKTAKQQSALLQKASASVAKTAKSKKSFQEKAVLNYVSEQLKKKAQEALKKPAAKKAVNTK